MKKLIKTWKELNVPERWDIDFHSPPELIKKFPDKLLTRVDSVASIAKEKRDPTKASETLFQYIDISSVDVSTGMISNPQELLGEEAPSRARKVVRAFDIVVSTCRPTRGAIAVVPPQLHNQIASTGFSIVRPNKGVNPFYLYYALRLSSTLEQFRKWSTGSSYPAILDEDVAKTLIPVPDPVVQDEIAIYLVNTLQKRRIAIQEANRVWMSALESIEETLSDESLEFGKAFGVQSFESKYENLDCTIKKIESTLKELPELLTDQSRKGEDSLFQVDLFSSSKSSLSEL